MRDLVLCVRDELLAAPNTVCLDRARPITEGYQLYDPEPTPIRRAKAFAHLLEHGRIDVHSNPVFAGKTSSAPRAWMLVPEHGVGADAQVLIENDGLAGILEDGGQELQVSCLDAEVLRGARAHPERHGDLLARVAGFSARFMDLSALQQEELIARAEARP